jgi:hypothetical protein
MAGPSTSFDTPPMKATAVNPDQEKPAGIEVGINMDTNEAVGMEISTDGRR